MVLQTSGAILIVVLMLVTMKIQEMRLSPKDAAKFAQNTFYALYLFTYLIFITISSVRL